MKRALIGGFISLIGSIWTLAIMLIAINNLTDEWYTPPGRLLTTIANLSMMPWFVISVILVILGIALMMIEYFKKEN